MWRSPGRCPGNRLASSLSARRTATISFGWRRFREQAQGAGRFGRILVFPLIHYMKREISSNIVGRRRSDAPIEIMKRSIRENIIVLNMPSKIEYDVRVRTCGVKRPVPLLLLLASEGRMSASFRRLWRKLSVLGNSLFITHCSSSGIS
jgi:hypothetical protein